MNVVGSKWVFKIKKKGDGTIDRYKARLVAQGFKQLEGIDFSHIYSLVVKFPTIRIVLSLVVFRGYKLCQIDGRNAFLQGDLDELVYMKQPKGYENKDCPNHLWLKASSTIMVC